jgi:hypothetical protein
MLAVRPQIAIDSRRSGWRSGSRFARFNSRTARGRWDEAIDTKSASMGIDTDQGTAPEPWPVVPSGRCAYALRKQAGTLGLWG